MIPTRECLPVRLLYNHAPYLIRSLQRAGIRSLDVDDVTRISLLDRTVYFVHVHARETLVTGPNFITYGIQCIVERQPLSGNRDGKKISRRRNLTHVTAHISVDS
jgi:hypothetical protein